MTYDQLVAFVAVATEGSFTAASASLHKSQPAISKLVKNLEDELRLQLFDRTEYRATLTHAGRLFFERAVTLLDSTRDLESFGAALAATPEPPLRLSVDAVAPLAPIIEVLKTLQLEHPSARIELDISHQAGVADALREADIVITTLVDIDPGALEVCPFDTVRIIPVVHADHPLARAGSPAPAQLLRDYAQVVLRSSRRELPRSINVLRGGLRWRVSDVAAKKELILRGAGWGGLPEHWVAAELEAGTLATLSIEEFDTPALALHLVRRRGHKRGPVRERLWQALSQLREHGDIPR